jgi:integrating conjugative element protein (TIGR03756 family)
MEDNMNKIFLLVLLVFCGTSSISYRTYADVGTINAGEVVNNTLECVGDCLDWKLVGICFWLECHLFDCEVNESPKVSHYIPDFLVSAYTTNHTPIAEYDGVNTGATANLTQSHSDDRQYDGPLDFKNAEVLGNPTALIFNQLADDSDYFCHSVVDVPYFPYFLSGIDTFWRSPSIEHFYPQAILGYPKIETNWPLGYWAQVYPLCGWGSHPYDAINAAVAAHRAAAIVTGNGVHVYMPPGSSCGNRCWAPGEIKEGKLSTHKFQMVFPVVADTGMVMGGAATWANGKNKNLDEGYAWSLWRPYTCCHKKGQLFLFSIDW